jgi:hypothetical protein
MEAWKLALPSGRLSQFRRLLRAPEFSNKIVFHAASSKQKWTAKDY